MGYDIEFAVDITHERLIEHWSTYRTAEESALIGGSPQTETKRDFLDKLGSLFCIPAVTSEISERQISLSNELMNAVHELLETNSVLLLDWDVVEEILCLRYVSSGWEPISRNYSIVPPDVTELQFQDYANRRKFLLKFFERLATVFEHHIESHDLQLEEALWFRDFWLKVNNCLILEVNEPYGVALERQLFDKRPSSFSSSVLQFRFVRESTQHAYAIEQRTPWIDRLLLRLISRSWPVMPCTRDEIDAAIALQETSQSQGVEFRFYSNARNRYEKPNRLMQDIDIRYFGKSFERALDRPLLSATEYLLQSGTTHEEIVSRQEIHLLYGLLCSYVTVASELPQDIASKELYFSPPDLPPNVKPISSPRVSVLPDNSRINPARDVTEVERALEAIV